MIRIFKENDLTSVMQIWLDTNIKAHNFIPKAYWTDSYATVIKMLPQAEVYVYEDDSTHQILGFIGLTGNYIAGIFVKEFVQSNGIGKQLLNYAKMIKTNLSLSVYQKNVRAVSFYQREQFFIRTENLDDSTNEHEFIMDWRR
ncbi:MAG: GNAT family N-acetyltransferase [bacterium]|nr:GNAT family N-acetyltransferase [bacterium]